MERDNREARYLLLGIEAVGIMAVSLLAFTQEQRQWIRQRDDEKCQFPVDFNDKSYKPCGSDKDLQVHHISPQRFSKQVLQWDDDKIDAPENAITLCTHHHQDIVHGDMRVARDNYGKDKKSFDKAFKHRNELVEDGEVYWNPTWDKVFKKIADKRTELFEYKGKEFPIKHGKRTVHA